MSPVIARSKATIAVGTLIAERPPHRTVRAAFPHTACMGLSLSRGRHAILVVLCIPFFCSTRAASILPSRPHISIAVARSGGQGRRFFSAAEGLSLTDASTAAGLYGAFFVKGITPFLSSFVIPFFCSTRAASILASRPHISIAVARSGGQGRRFFSAAEGLSLTDASTAAGCRRSGGWPRDDPRGACHWPRSIARTTLVFG